MSVTFSPSDGSQGFSGSYDPDLNIRVSCSDNRNACPSASIFDARQMATPVDVAGTPPPLQRVVVGSEMDLRVDWKQGTGYTSKGN